MKIMRALESHGQLILPLFDAYRVFYGQSSDMQRARQFIHERLKKSDSIIFLATDETETRGCGFAQLYPSFTSIGTAKIFILNDLYVDPRYRQQGVARNLLEAVRRFVIENDAMRIVLETAESNFLAQALYESLGYQKEQGFFTYTLELSH